ncbi:MULTISPECIES: HdeD family acid-resistance protein [unclassified Gilliamella]|uniref:HdeD family acid-resistance protein n=1 Tax=unclassified Gilliamella TaxID=2685620 RepID=UPI001C6A6706|nr:MULTISPECIES: HdeD family acid-resistance protein [unclassified Gilliamella]MCX8575000.1 HdeD family acid-resistance protein [Gilliamella sp. B3831]MCX8577382.1 HdeD family acid-resistance protein [Gilliamella sp. B3815]MCX8579506.1 HdeD family acid-resistance protein [Gilliamella sp. B2717]MCX8588757.1 HdeD family acid-resistance protein [Gilliamella sp. B3801]MCX8590098.1 HdeD family acid-resistance protein [Gilliamella sp. B3812]
MISTENNTQDLKQKTGWFIFIGVILIILGCLALGYQFIATVFSVYFIGSLLLIAGIAQIIHAFNIKGFGQTALWAVMGILYIFIGLMAYFQPIAVSSAFTLLISLLLVISGFTQIFASLNNREIPRWGWILASGIITLILGLMIIAGWPYDSLWVLGMFLGIDLIFQGWAYVAIGFALKKRQ